MFVHTALHKMRNLPLRDFADAFGTTPILVLAPHPDDESLGCGGLIAEACRRGNPPVVAILTDGSKSHPNSRSHPADRLRALREYEAASAVAGLGLPSERLLFLRYPDGGAPSAGIPMFAAAEQVASLIGKFGCTTVVTSWRHDPHCDHAAANAIAQRACGLTSAIALAYPIWGWTLPPDMLIDEPPISGFRLDIEGHLDAKRAAIQAHRSQYAGLITDDPDGFQMPPDFIERFLLPTETYVEMGVSA